MPAMNVPDRRDTHRRVSGGAGPLGVARTAFRLLTIGPEPISIDGVPFDGLPDRRVPLDEVRDLLLARDCHQAARDAVWAHLVQQSRARGHAWTVGCVGVGLPALTRVAARLSARFAADPTDIHAEILSGFMHAVATVDVHRPRIMLRLRWAAYRAGHAAVKAALDAPIPVGEGFHSTEPPLVGHPDLVLARAVTDGAITPGEANLIGATRLENVSLRRHAADHGVSYEACKKTRQRAERRLVAYLRDDNTSGSTCTGSPTRTSTFARGSRRGEQIRTSGARAGLGLSRVSREQADRRASPSGGRRQSSKVRTTHHACT